MAREADLPTLRGSSASSRVAVYVIPDVHRFIGDAVRLALTALAEVVDRVVVVVPQGTAPAHIDALCALASDVLVSPWETYDDAVYPWAVETAGGDEDEIVLTGDSWYGPVGDLGAVLGRMQASATGLWTMVEAPQHRTEAFPDEGFADEPTPWIWTTVSRAVVTSAAWQAFWSATGRDHGETALRLALHASGLPVAYAFPASGFPGSDPGLFAAPQLIDAGCPIVRRDVFTRYPPFLDRFAIVGRQLLERIAVTGYPVAAILQSLARSMPLKALYANAAMLEVLSGTGAGYDPERPQRIAAIVHVTDVDGVPELLDRLSFLPHPFDLFLTTTDGKRATELQRLVTVRADSQVHRVDVRVTAANRGRDMSDLLVGCRDVLLSGGYDIIVKLHARRTRKKTLNVRRYFRRYEYENLLDSPGHVRDLLGLFQREAGLGLVFPPMVHIGYSTMGSGWAGLREKATEMAEGLDIRVPLDEISPMAPFGAMWVGRPEALALLAQRRWRYSDYQRGPRGDGSLAHVQERMVAYAAGDLGYHSRCVLTPEHAAISHTAIEFKSDSLFATTRGWPVEQIRLMHRAGATGHGGVVALSRMYVRMNHPRLSRVLMPVYDVALRSVVALRYARAGAGDVTRMVRGLPTEGRR